MQTGGSSIRASVVAIAATLFALLTFVANLDGIVRVVSEASHGVHSFALTVGTGAATMIGLAIVVLPNLPWIALAQRSLNTKTIGVLGAATVVSLFAGGLLIVDAHEIDRAQGARQGGAPSTSSRSTSSAQQPSSTQQTSPAASPSGSAKTTHGAVGSGATSSGSGASQAAQTSKSERSGTSRSPSKHSSTSHVHSSASLKGSAETGGYSTGGTGQGVLRGASESPPAEPGEGGSLSGSE